MTASHRALFQDPAHQQAFERDGFVVCPFIEESDVAALRVLFERIRPAAIEGIYSNVQASGAEINWEVDRAINGAFREPASRTFIDCWQGGVTYLVKGVGPGSASTLHQDWNNVDESQATSLSIWVPLVDVDEGNGCLQVLPGSHRAPKVIRGLTTPSVYLDFDHDLEPFLRSVPMEAGWACIYAHNLFHGSKPNLTADDRVAVVSGVRPLEAQHLHYWQDPSGDGTVTVLEVDDRFLYEHVRTLAAGVLPQGARVAAVDPLGRGPLTREEVLASCRTSTEPRCP